MALVNRAVQESFPVAFGQTGNANPLSILFPNDNNIPMTVRLINSSESTSNFVVTFEDSDDGVTYADVTGGPYTVVPGGSTSAAIIVRQYFRTKAGGSGSGEIVLVPPHMDIQLTRI